MDTKHIQKIIKEFNFLNRKNKYPNECPCYTNKICHNLPEEKLNCFLCYCPEYKSEIEGGCKINNPNGKWLFNEKLPKGKIWDCSDCDYPHREEIVEKYLKRIFLSKNKMQIKIKKLHRDAIIPKYAHEGDAGMDLHSIEEVTIHPGERVVIGTGISIELPKDYVVLVWDKSGLAANYGITTMAGVGDSGYRGEYKIVLLNTSYNDYTIKKGQKITQILIQKVETAEIKQVNELTESSRGKGRFGSTGL
jgi:dUTP pyrophosphatase